MLLLLPAQDGSSLDQTLSTISPAASGAQGTGGTGASACLERDYANERC